MYDGKGSKKYAENNSVLTVPYSKPKFLKKHKYSLWWDSDCSNMINKRKLSYKKFANNSLKTNLLEHRIISQNTRKELNKKKRNNFRKFVDSLNLYKGPTKFWNAIKSFKN